MVTIISIHRVFGPPNITPYHQSIHKWTCSYITPNIKPTSCKVSTTLTISRNITIVSFSVSFFSLITWCCRFTRQSFLGEKSWGTKQSSTNTSLFLIFPVYSSSPCLFTFSSRASSWFVKQGWETLMQILAKTCSVSSRRSD